MHHSSLFTYTYIFINYYDINIDLKRFVRNNKLGFSGVKIVIYSPMMNSQNFQTLKVHTLRFGI
ncbi:hypothetical protein bcgnr5390_63280 [Bacillus luti]|nr:hypothetical protein bcere0029_59660 [Bacillus cereus AH1272]